MDAIFYALEDFRKGTTFPIIKPYLQVLFLLLVGGMSALMVGMAVCADDLRAILRRAIVRSGYSDRQCAEACGKKPSHFSEYLSGDRSINLELLARLPVAVRQWFAVGIAEVEGVPSVIQPAASLCAVATKESAA